MFRLFIRAIIAYWFFIIPFAYEAKNSVRFDTLTYFCYRVVVSLALHREVLIPAIVPVKSHTPAAAKESKCGLIERHAPPSIWRVTPQCNFSSPRSIETCPQAIKCCTAGAHLTMDKRWSERPVRDLQ